MRPVELHLQGITSFTDATHIDFRDTDVFVLTGPTGAGKSSILDAIALSLYGRIPRLGDRSIAPVLSTKSTTGKVVLTFAAAGQTYRVFRELRRDKRGNVSVRDAVLETIDDEGETVDRLAEDTGGVTDKVEEILGLDFSQFQQVVMLPQGGYDRLLSARPKQRRELLLELLDFGPIETIRSLAAQRHSHAKGIAEQLEVQQFQLAHATDDALAQAQSAAEELAGLVDSLRADDSAYTALKDRQQAEQDAVKAAEEQLQLIRRAAAGAPPDLTDLLGQITTLDAKVAEADRAVERAWADKSAADEALQAIDPETVRKAVQAHTDAKNAATQADEAEQQLPGLAQQVTDAAGKLQTVTREAQQATRQLRDAMRAHGVHLAAKDLGAGDPCPICTTPLAGVPELDGDIDLDALEAADQAAATKLQQAQHAHVTATTRHTNAVEHAQKLRTAATQARNDADAILDIDAARNGWNQLAPLEKAVADTQKALKDATDIQTRAKAARAAIDPQVAAATSQLDRLIDDLHAPTTSGALADRWAELADWAAAHQPAAEKAVTDAQQTVDATMNEIGAAANTMVAKLATAGIDAQPGIRPVETAVQAATAAAARHTQLLGEKKKLDGITSDLNDVIETRAITAEVARLCKSDQFQNWLVDEALDDLCAAATERLLDLSNGRYQVLVSPKGEIEIADLHNGGEVRPSKTLSGGETFLVSLSLALTVADRISASAQSPVNADSIYLDEGFGTLDPAHLDAAVDVLEALAAEDRTVGVITHVRDLADRMPVRFEVASAASNGGSATVTRVIEGADA